MKKKSLGFVLLLIIGFVFMTESPSANKIQKLHRKKPRGISCKDFISPGDN